LIGVITEKINIFRATVARVATREKEYNYFHASNQFRPEMSQSKQKGENDYGPISSTGMGDALG